MKKLVYLVAVLFLTGVGCTKQHNMNPSQQNEKTNSGYSTQSYVVAPLITGSPANPSNPFDSFGLIHNQIVILTQGVWGQTNFSIQSTEDLNQLYLAELNAFSALGLGNNPVPSFNDFQSVVNETISDTAISFDTFIDASSLSSQAKNYAQMLYEKFDSMDDADSFESYIASYVVIESNIENDNILSPSEKTLLLRTASVFRYSSVLWTNFIYNDLGEGTGSVTTMMDDDPDKKNLWQKTKAFLKKHKKQLIAAGSADAKAAAGSGGGWGKVAVVVGASAIGYLTTKP